MFETLPSHRRGNAINASRFLTMLVRNGLTATGDVAHLGLHLPALYEQVPEEHRQGVAIVLYQPGLRRILVVRRRKDFARNLIEAVDTLRSHPRFVEFDLSDGARVQFDFFEFVESDISFKRFSASSMPTGGFEFGLDGLRIAANGKDHYFLPGDSYVRSILGLGQLRRHLQRLTGTDRIEDLPMDRLRSTSFISFGNEWLPLYRGHPVTNDISAGEIAQVCDRAIDNIVANSRSDGRFMYYYDAARDSHIDHEHPGRDPETDPYYNELRHCGGIVTLLLGYARRPDRGVLPIVDRAIAFLERISHVYQTADGRTGRYLLFNRKSKLGGGGLALYSLGLYQHVTGSTKFAGMANELASHLLSEVLENGEFRYYHIYLDKKVDRDENKDYFSFYYPGEALIGLAAYLKWIGASEPWRAKFESKIKAALHYLLVDRPRERAAEYQSLPSDSWLMAAINEFWDMPEFRDPAYSQFVFDGADRMIAQMYTESDALFPDYVGGFYYQFGDLPYPDGARCEGLVAALALAEKLGLAEHVRRYASALVKTTRATILLANTPESLYFAPNPKKSLGGIRFKPTRQWFRIDTIQHVVCYYLRFLDIYRRLVETSVPLDDGFPASAP
jgi:hypothetical protein